MSDKNNIRLRTAVAADIPALRLLIEASVRGLQAQDYTPAQIEGALKTVFGVDSQLIADGTYFVAEAGVSAAAVDTNASSSEAAAIQQTDPFPPSSFLLHPFPPHPFPVACGGWSKRKTLFGADHWSGREDDLLDAARDAAKIRAFFVHPDWARRGIGSVILDACEAAARAAGFSRFEMGATLTGVPLYRSKGYIALECFEAPLENGESLTIVRMAKST